jgi:hypothetical protein
MYYLLFRLINTLGNLKQTMDEIELILLNGINNMTDWSELKLIIRAQF